VPHLFASAASYIWNCSGTLESTMPLEARWSRAMAHQWRQLDPSEVKLDTGQSQ
jgi:hypothetical protein